MSISDQGSYTLHDLDCAISAASAFVENLHWQFSDFRQQISIGFFLTIVEQSDAIHLLCQNQKYFDAQIILRSLIEHYVELKIIWIEDLYIERLKLEFNTHTTNMLNASMAGNPYAPIIPQKIDFKSEIDSLAKEKEDILLRGGGKNSIIQRFRSANEEDFYNTAFRHLSKFVHPSIAGHVARHFSICQTTGKPLIKSRRAPEVETVENTIHSTITTLTNSSQILKENFSEKSC